MNGEEPIPYEFYDAACDERDSLRHALEQAHEDLESILPPRGHEELAQGVYFAYQRLDRALGGTP